MTTLYLIFQNIMISFLCQAIYVFSHYCDGVCSRERHFTECSWRVTYIVRPDHSHITTIVGRSNCRGNLGLGWMDDAAFRFPVGILGIVGEVGLVLLLVHAGLAMDLPVLQQVGMRVMVMALLGSDRSCRPSLVPSWLLSTGRR
jgi:hypothetical protein